MATKTEPQDPGASTVNRQIADTIAKLQQMGPSEADALCKSAEAEARVLARSLALQDAVAHLRRVQVLNEAALSLAVTKQAAGDMDAGEAIMKTATAAMDQARAMLAEAEKAQD